MTLIRRYFAVTWHARTWREVTYLLLGLPVAIVWFTYTVSMYLTGVALVIVWVGVVIVALVQWTLRPIGDFERGTANALLHAGIDEPPPRRYRLREPGKVPTLEGTGNWGYALLYDAQGWRTLAWLMMRIVLGPVGFVLALCAIVVPVALTGAWVAALAHTVGLTVVQGSDEQAARAVADTVAFWILVGTPVVALAVPMFAWVTHYYASLVALLARAVLGPGGSARIAEATERAELAETQVRVDQELHDSIGHMITMNIVQAGAGAHVFDADPDFARQALRNIEERGRVAMGELDRIIAAIRGDDAQSRAPVPTLEDLPGLVDQARSAGLDVETRLEAEPTPAALSRAAYAVVRESVTNAAKHAPGASIHLHVTTLDDALAVCVRNGPATPGEAPLTGLRPAHAGIGRGVAGIRDRAALLGGVSVIGPCPDGGYEVMVLLPLGMALAAPADGAHAGGEGCCQWNRARARVGA
ncbi:sensor histidine kinase [Demequina sp. SO4-18]|uniref:sensor histidine kinase n=1 Tax=Demequina sp. SO4-18 TaxID=3401026 RepID=UPI003B5CF594